MRKPEEKTEQPQIVRCQGCGLKQFWPGGKTACDNVRCGHRVGWRLTKTFRLVPEAGERPGVPAGLFDNVALGGRLRELRKARHLSQQGAGELAKMKRTYISRVENGRIQLRTDSLERLAAGLGVTAEMVLDERITAHELRGVTIEELRGREDFMAEVTAMLPAIDRAAWPTICDAAKSLAAGQYILPEWMQV